MKNKSENKIKWKLMYEGPRLSHLLAQHVFIEPFREGWLEKYTGYKHVYYLWYSDSREKGGLHGGYYIDSEMKKETKQGLKNFLSDKWYKNWKKLIDDLDKETEEFRKKTDLEFKIDEYSDKKLAEFASRMTIYVLKLASLMRCSQPQCTDGLVEKLYKQLKGKIKPELVEEVFVTLTLPEKKLKFTFEKLDWLDILIKARKKYPQLYRLVVNHYKKYRLIPASDRTPPWELETLINQLKINLGSKIDFTQEKKTLEDQYDNAVKNKKNLILKYKLGKEALNLGRRLSEIGFYRFKSGYAWRWIGYYFVVIVKYIAKKYNLTFWEASSLDIKELIETLQKSKLTIPEKELSKRADAELYVVLNNKHYVYFGDEARKKKIEMLGEVDYSKVVELKGSIGSLGECRGKAFVFYWSDDVAKKIKKMPKDSILVAPQTHPTYMPAISIAKGLVVDEGGITGHAAVVARELNKPCVIGIHIATKAIQTGDELEVDANNGIVKILRRASK